MKINKGNWKDECGVIGVYAPNDVEAAQLVYYGLYALQHRGQESAGIAVSEGTSIDSHKGMGLVPEVFQTSQLNQLQGCMGIGHVRYSTTGESDQKNAQPLVVSYKNNDIALAHNGNLVNALSIREMLEDEGVIFQTTLDTEVIANLLARYYKDGIVSAIQKTMEVIKGAFALVIMMNGKLIGVRDNYALRPLCLGKIDGGYMMASESCALDTIGATYQRELAAGEILIIDENGIESIPSNKICQKKSCIFELIYFSRPDSVIDSIGAYQFRHEAGKILAKESVVEADIVMAVPDSGIPAAIGFAEESGIPYGVGLIKNRYIGRTFIQPSQEQREQGVRIKLNALKDNVVGKRVIIVDDSIVRGTTSKRIVSILRKAGAKEVHFRVCSPPVKHPCHFGIDTPDQEHLIGAIKTTTEIKTLIGADSLAFLSIEGMNQVTHHAHKFCKACFDGNYPMEVPRSGKKLIFE